MRFCLAAIFGGRAVNGLLEHAGEIAYILKTDGFGDGRHSVVSGQQKLLCGLQANTGDEVPHGDAGFFFAACHSWQRRHSAQHAARNERCGAFRSAVGRERSGLIEQRKMQAVGARIFLVKRKPRARREVQGNLKR